MRRLHFLLAVLLLTGVIFSATAAKADDLYPPIWRGQSGTTFEEWQFSTPNPVTTPEPGYVNPWGVPSAHAYPGTGQFWVDQWGGHQGMWPLSGTVEITIPNRPQPLPYKDIWVQLTWAKQVSSSTPVVWDMISGVQGSIVRDVVLGPTGYGSPNDFWYHTTYSLHLEPNPNFEIIKIDGTLVLDQVVIDTICAPEPATIGLLGFAAMLVLRRRPI